MRAIWKFMCRFVGRDVLRERMKQVKPTPKPISGDSRSISARKPMKVCAVYTVPLMVRWKYVYMNMAVQSFSSDSRGERERK